MIRLRRPGRADLDAFLSSQSGLPFSYAAVGDTRASPPVRHVVDHNRAFLGRGEACYRAAISAIEHWKMFEIPWLELHPRGSPIEVGTTVAVLTRQIGVWWINACRIVYEMAEQGACCRFGFAYGTLPDHAESGEERFLVEWDRADDSVWYDLLAFSRPNHPLVRLAHPIARRLQREFARDSMSSMRAAVESARQGSR